MERPTRAGHYRTLGLSKLATKDDIKKAYPKRVLEVHPDKTARATAAEFIQVYVHAKAFIWQISVCRNFTLGFQRRWKIVLRSRSRIWYTIHRGAS